MKTAEQMKSEILAKAGEDLGFQGAPAWRSAWRHREGAWCDHFRRTLP